jgi:mono/diheme cytochrome c family protein
MPLLAMLALCALASVLGVFAQDKPVIKRVPIRATWPTDGAEMFKAYCATCHGIKGEGDGPAASALKKVPGNLTRLSERNNGKFPSARVTSVIEGRDGVDAHGNREMPIWGPIFRSLASSGADRETVLRIHNLTKYVESIQRP